MYGAYCKILKNTGKACKILKNGKIYTKKQENNLEALLAKPFYEVCCGNWWSTECPFLDRTQELLYWIFTFRDWAPSNGKSCLRPCYIHIASGPSLLIESTDSMIPMCTACYYWIAMTHNYLCMFKCQTMDYLYLYTPWWIGWLR